MHDDTPGCVTVIVCPAAVIVPVREAVPALEAALKLSDPAPVPFAPAGIVSQLAVVAAFHAHPVPVLIVAVPVPPEGGTD